MDDFPGSRSFDTGIVWYDEMISESADFTQMFNSYVVFGDHRSDRIFFIDLKRVEAEQSVRNL